MLHLGQVDVTRKNDTKIFASVSKGNGNIVYVTEIGELGVRNVGIYSATLDALNLLMQSFHPKFASNLLYEYLT